MTVWPSWKVTVPPAIPVLTVAFSAMGVCAEA